MKGFFKSPSQAFFTPYSSKTAFYESVDMAKQCSCKSVPLGSRERIRLFVKYQMGQDEWEPIMISIFKDLAVSELKRKILETLKSEIFNFQKPDQILLQFNGHRLPQSETIQNLLESMAQIRAIPLFSFNKRATKSVPTQIPESFNEATTQDSSQEHKAPQPALPIYTNQTKAKQFFSMFKKPEQPEHKEQNKQRAKEENRKNSLKLQKETSREETPRVQPRTENDKQEQKQEESEEVKTQEFVGQVENGAQENKKENESEQEEESESESSSGEEDEESIENKLEEAWGEKSSKITQKQSVGSSEGSKRPRNLFV